MIDILGTTMIELQDYQIRDVEASDLWEGKSWGNGNSNSLNCTCLAM